MRFKNISMNVWLIFACELQTNLIIKEDANAVKLSVYTRLPKPLLETLPIYGNYFRQKNFQALNWFSDYFIATPEFQTFSAKPIKMVKASSIEINHNSW